MVSQYEKYIRQHALIHPHTQQATGWVIGVGMLGSWTAHALARMLRQVVVWDDDKVGNENVGCQAYSEVEIGVPKTEAIAVSLSGLGVETMGRFPGKPRDWPPLGLLPQVVVSCVDSLEGRRDIAKFVKTLVRPPERNVLFVDTRALAEMATVVCVTEPEQFAWYLDDLPNEKDTIDVLCGGEGTAFVGMWVASTVAALVNGYFRGVTPPRKLVWHVGLNQQITREEVGT